MRGEVLAFTLPAWPVPARCPSAGVATTHNALPSTLSMLENDSRHTTCAFLMGPELKFSVSVAFSIFSYWRV